MKAILKAMLKSGVGRAIIETLLIKFLEWMHSQGYDVRWNGGRDVVTPDTLKDKIQLFTQTKL